MKKKVVSTLLAVAMLATVVTGCGSSDNKATENNDTVVETADTTTDTTTADTAAAAADATTTTEGGLADKTVGVCIYQFNDNFVFEVYAQPYHLTDIVLEEGEVVIGTPLLSEDESVWELTAGVAKNPLTGKDVQHLFVKPAYSKQDSSLVIITDRRVYHFRLRSFSDTHMAMVKFSYPLEKNVWAEKEDPNKGREIISDYLRVSNPELLSFDYKIKYSRFKKPEFLPNRIYDDGQCTYIQVEPVVLQKKLPVLFNEKNEIVNYSVHKNTFVIPRLINKITLRLGKEKVVVEKKVTKKTDLEKTEPTEESEAGGDE